MPTLFPDLICSPEFSDAAILSGASTLGDLTIQNLKDIDPGLVTRFASLASMYVEIDLQVERVVDYLWLRSPNITVNGEIGWRLADTQINLTADPVLDSGILPFVGFTLDPGDPLPSIMTWPYKDHHLDLRSNPQTVRWLRFDITDPDNTSTFNAGIDLSRLYVSFAMRPPFGVTIQDIVPMSTPVRIESQGGSIHPVIKPVRNSTTILAKGLTKAQAFGSNGIFEMLRSRSVDRDVLVVMDDDPLYRPQRTIYGLLSEIFPITSENKSHYEYILKLQDLSDMRA